MHQNLKRTLVVLGTAAALTAPAAATAKKGGKGERPDRSATKGPKVKTMNLKGTVVSRADSLVTVNVTKGDSRGRRFAGQELVLDVTSTRVKVRDSNGDGTRNVADIVAGDRFVAKVRVPTADELASGNSLVARKFVDQGPPAVDEADEADEQETEELETEG